MRAAVATVGSVVAVLGGLLVALTGLTTRGFVSPCPAEPCTAEMADTFAYGGAALVAVGIGGLFVGLRALAGWKPAFLSVVVVALLVAIAVWATLAYSSPPTVCNTGVNIPGEPTLPPRGPPCGP